MSTTASTLPNTFDNTAHLISKARHSVNDFLMIQMEEVGIDGFVPSHGDIVVTLLKQEAMTMRELSAAIQRDPSTVTALVKKLAHQGIVMLKDNPHDTRSRLVSLTEQGKELQKVFAPISHQLAQTMWQDISDEERKLFRSILKKIIHNFQSTSTRRNA
ncbi:MAG TPA: MarR family transcriptional regulator [Chloroflexi bacterium]|nr:MarR family transcriptional regulator [Chloroflexota bacterium]